MKLKFKAVGNAHSKMNVYGKSLFGKTMAMGDKSWPAMKPVKFKR